MVTAKFKVASVLDSGFSKTVIANPVYSSDKTSPNYSWSQWTPSGELKLCITNPDAFNQFAPGKVFIMTLEEVSE